MPVSVSVYVCYRFIQDEIIKHLSTDNKDSKARTSASSGNPHLSPTDVSTPQYHRNLTSQTPAPDWSSAQYALGAHDKQVHAYQSMAGYVDQLIAAHTIEPSSTEIQDHYELWKGCNNETLAPRRLISLRRLWFANFFTATGRDIKLLPKVIMTMVGWCLMVMLIDDGDVDDVGGMMMIASRWWWWW